MSFFTHIFLDSINNNSIDSTLKIYLLDDNKNTIKEKEFNAHRLILSYHSTFFMDAFLQLIDTPTNTDEISKKSNKKNRNCKERRVLTIHFESSQKNLYKYFHLLFDYLYGKPYQPNDKTSFHVLSLSKKFGVSSLYKSLSDYISSQVNKNNVIDILKFSISELHESIKYRCFEVIAKSFDHFLSHNQKDLFFLPIQQLSELLNNPNLFITEEYSFYQLIRSYLKYRKDKYEESFTSGHLVPLFNSLRLPYMTLEELENVITDDIVPKQLLCEALLYRLSFYENTTINRDIPSRLQRREVGICFEYKSDMDNNGIIYYLATGFGKTEWKNPSLTGSVKVSSSSIEKGKVHNIVDLLPKECWTKEIPSSWFSLDLRQGKLIPTHYTLRHGSNSKMECLRNWSFQASDDEKNWVELSRHQNDTNLNNAFSTHTWKIHMDNPKPFRHFRILQTGHNSSNNNFLSLSGIELYGEFFANPVKQLKDKN